MRTILYYTTNATLCQALLIFLLIIYKRIINILKIYILFTIINKYLKALLYSTIFRSTINSEFKRRAFYRHAFRIYYSVRSATTGSFFAALFAGARPEISVRPTLKQTRNTAFPTGRAAIPEKFIKGVRITLTTAEIR